MTVPCSELFLCSSATINPKNRSLRSVVCHFMIWCVSILWCRLQGIQCLGTWVGCFRTGLTAGALASFSPPAPLVSHSTDVLLHSVVLSHIYTTVTFRGNASQQFWAAFACCLFISPGIQQSRLSPGPLCKQTVLLTKDLLKMHPLKLNRWTKQVKSYLNAIALSFPSEQGFVCCSIILT